MSHAEVAFIYWAATAACGAVGWLVSAASTVAQIVALSVMSAAAIVVSTAVRRFADRRGIEGV